MSEDYTPTDEEVESVFAMGTIDVSMPYEQSIEANHEMFDRWLAAHDAELREQIARDIEARKPRASKLSEYVTGVRRGIYLAARIARGKAS